jgi:two-component system, NarL family, nitrate/nitrite response regulator NarL
MKCKSPDLEPSIVRIVLIDNHVILRDGLKSLICTREGLTVVGEASGPAEAITLVKKEQPDVILLGVEPNDGKVLDVLPQLVAVSSESRVLVLSASTDSDVHRRAVLLGAVGVVTRDKPANILLKAIERVHAGEAWLDHNTMASVLTEFSPRKKKIDPEEHKIATLTEREREVIKQVGEGLKNKQIAERLFISDSTVHHHLTSIYSKLDVSDRLELFIYSYRNGLAEAPH